MRRPGLRSLVLVSLLLAWSGAPAEAGREADPGGGSPPTVLYRLGGDSAFIEGCVVGLCLCPVKFTYMAGTFGVTPIPDGVVGVQTFAISEIDWFTHLQGEVRGTIAGSGTYTLGQETHRLVLDLSLDDDPPIHVDSGDVPRGDGFPAIDIGGLTDTDCYQEGVDVYASPAAPSIAVSLVEPATLTWTVDPRADVYDVVAGDLMQLRATGGDFTMAATTCVADDIPGAGMAYTDPVAEGAALWFLVRGLPQPGYDSDGAGQVAPRDWAIDAAPGGCP